MDKMDIYIIVLYSGTIATSSSPWGPFTDSGRPIVEDNWNCVACYIDPTYFRDPKAGKHYLIWKGDRLVHTQFLSAQYSCLVHISATHWFFSHPHPRARQGRIVIQERIPIQRHSLDRQVEEDDLFSQCVM